MGLGPPQRGRLVLAVSFTFLPALHEAGPLLSHLAEEVPALLWGSLAKVTQRACATLVGSLGWSRCMVGTALRHLRPSGWPRGAAQLGPASL